MLYIFSFFFNDTATTEIYTLSLHDALPIFRKITGLAPISRARFRQRRKPIDGTPRSRKVSSIDRKSTRLNSSHSQISYAVFCLKKKKKKKKQNNIIHLTFKLVQSPLLISYI